jgi:hypothetical protein
MTEWEGREFCIAVYQITGRCQLPVGRGVPKLQDNCEQLSLQVGALLPGLQDLPTGAVFAVLAEFFLLGV